WQYKSGIMAPRELINSKSGLTIRSGIARVALGRTPDVQKLHDKGLGDLLPELWPTDPNRE
ncbi:hypothetical protein, partial [Rhizobium sp. SL86]|uniref:hypothetical protein n=1 Tax=Rhizobium sp. SL86 TaxID=2995148 RepID=UPI00227276A9